MIDKYIYKLREHLQVLYPTGRAWENPSGSAGDVDLMAKAEVFSSLFSDIDTIAQNAVPNLGMSEDWLEQWEDLLGVRYNPNLLTIEERRIEVIRLFSGGEGYNYTQSKEFIEYQLNAAGFDVKVYRIDGSSDIPNNSEVIANSIDIESNFNVSNYAYAFVIAGDDIATKAVIPVAKRDEFIKTILRYMPMDMVCFLNSNVSNISTTSTVLYSSYVCALSDEQNTGVKRARIITINRTEQDGSQVSGYPKNYDYRDHFNNYYRLSSRQIQIMTDEAYSSRLEDFKQYIQDQEEGIYIDGLATSEAQFTDESACPVIRASYGTKV